MNKQENSGLIRVNFDCPREVHQRFKSILSLDGRNARDTFLDFIEKTVNGSLPSENGAGVKSSLSERTIEAVIESRLAEVLKQLKEAEDSEAKVYSLEKPIEKPVVKSPEVKKTIEEGEKERVLVAENGVIATGKKVVLAEKIKIKRTCWHWLIDGGNLKDPRWENVEWI